MYWVNSGTVGPWQTQKLANKQLRALSVQCKQDKVNITSTKLTKVTKLSNFY